LLILGRLAVQGYAKLKESSSEHTTDKDSVIDDAEEDDNVNHKDALGSADVYLNTKKEPKCTLCLGFVRPFFDSYLMLFT
jgi:hypothetical protein